MEAMQMLESELGAYLECDRIENLKTQFNDLNLMPNKIHNTYDAVDVVNDAEENVELDGDDVEEEDCRELFKHMSLIKLHMEALTLQDAGIETLALVQNDVRPIFTIECRLSPELIQQVKRPEMFHIMQFESEKFNNMTHCTRFGEDDRRHVRLSLSETDAAAKSSTAGDSNLNFGRIHITVWWRELGTCFNEMLGVGVLELADLYKAGTLEQCKCIAVSRRNKHLLNVYMKINIFTDKPQQLNKLERRLSQVPPFDLPPLSGHMAWKVYALQQQQQTQQQPNQTEYADVNDKHVNDNNDFKTTTMITTSSTSSSSLETSANNLNTNSNETGKYKSEVSWLGCTRS